MVEENSKRGTSQIDLWALAENYASGKVDQDGKCKFSHNFILDGALSMGKLANEKQKTILFVGEKKTGKSSLIAKFFGDNVKEDMGETIALDYKFSKLMQEDKT